MLIDYSLIPVNDKTAFIKSLFSIKKSGFYNVAHCLQKHTNREGSVFSDIQFRKKTANETALNVAIGILESKNIICLELDWTFQIYDLDSKRGISMHKETSAFNGFREYSKV